MKCFVSLILSILITCASPVLSAQQNPVISKPVLTLEGTTLVISFEISSSYPLQKYNIRMEVSDAEGNEILPQAISGDIGEKISSGDNKVIRWDLKADQISMERILDVVIVGSIAESEGSTGSDAQVTRLGAIGRSVVFPGWGLSKVHPGKPHWIKGVGAYGCMAGALILNQRAHANYQNYLDSGDAADREMYYDRSVNQEQFSVVLAYAAAGIWLADMIWTVAGTGNLSKKSTSVQRTGLTIGADYETIGHAPMLVLKYAF
ncbi:MAG: hypothetical protein V2B15_14850 [Bacteroidota bacterium]